MSAKHTSRGFAAVLARCLLVTICGLIATSLLGLDAPTAILFQIGTEAASNVWHVYTLLVPA